MRRPARLLECNIHFVHASNFQLLGRDASGSERVRGALVSSEAAAILARMRSLLIMIGDDRMSRRWRPTLNSPSLR